MKYREENDLMALPVKENEPVIAMRQRMFVKYVTSVLVDPCSKTLS